MDLQQSSGEFRWDPTLEPLFGVTRDQLSERFQAHGCGEEGVAVTVAVLVYLERKCADQKDLWELMAQKAARWLGKAVGKDRMEELKAIL